MGRKNSSSTSNKRKKDPTNYTDNDKNSTNKKMVESRCKQASEAEILSKQQINKQIKKQDKSQARRLTKKQKIQARARSEAISSVVDSQDGKDHTNGVMTLPNVCSSKDENKPENLQTSTKDVVLIISKHDKPQNKSTSVSNGSNKQEKPSFKTTNNSVVEKSDTVQAPKNFPANSKNLMALLAGNPANNVVKETTPSKTSRLFCQRRVNAQPLSYTALPKITKPREKMGLIDRLWCHIARIFCCSQESVCVQESPQNPLALEYGAQNFFKEPQDPIAPTDSYLNNPQSVPKIYNEEESKPHTTALSQKSSSKHLGLPNIGLTCYMNSTLQCLLASNSLMQEINGIQKPGEVTTLLKEIYAYARTFQDNNGNYNIRGVLRRLVTVLGFEIWTENDAHAFYLTLLDRLIEEHKPLDRFFFGEFRIVGECNGCGLISPFEEPFTELVLPSKKKCPTRVLSTCVDFCFKPKRLQCCKCQSQKILKPTLSYAPEILVILFEKNVRDDIQIEEIITIPMNKEKIDYILLGVVEYSGNGDYGHYTAITWHQIKEGYHRYNDSTVSKYIFTTNSTNTPLLCFYEKV